jgi:hypothetical protein
MAAPVLGGLLIADRVVDIFIPVRFYWVRRYRWLKMHGIDARPRRATTRRSPPEVHEISHADDGDRATWRYRVRRLLTREEAPGRRVKQRRAAETAVT